jgi:hypothetical protein
MHRDDAELFEVEIKRPELDRIQQIGAPEDAAIGCSGDLLRNRIRRLS